MNDNTELIAQIRDYARGDTDAMLDKAADALEALQAEVTRLKAELGDLHGKAVEVIVDREEALARIAELETQEPLGYFFCADDHWQQAHDPIGFPGHTPLFAAVGASPQPVQPSQAVELSRHEIEVIAEAFDGRDFAYAAFARAIIAAINAKGAV